MRNLAWVLVLGVSLFGCKKVETGPTVVATETATDGPAVLELSFAYEAKGERQMDFSVSMKAIGMEEMDKLVLQVEIGDFHIADGSARWTGFVAPRDPQRHTVRLLAADGVDEPVLNVYLTRSHDSQMLLNESIQFEVQEGQLVAR